MKKWDSPALSECVNKDTTRQNIHFASMFPFLCDPRVNPTVILQRAFDKTPSSGNCSFVILQRGTDTSDCTQVLALPCGATLYKIPTFSCQHRVNYVLLLINAQIQRNTPE